MVRLLSVCILALALVAQQAGAEPRALKVVADEWPPFSGAALPNQGMSLDVISTVLRRAGYTVETQVMPWARIIASAKTDTVDIVGSLFADTEQATYLNYANPFHTTRIQLVRRLGSDITFRDVPSLQPYSFAVGDGFLYEPEFDRADYLQKQTVTTTLQAMQMVAFGRVDLTLDSVDVVNFAMQNEDPRLQERVEIAPGVMAHQGIHMAVRRTLDGNEQIVADFNATLAQMQSDGSLDALLAVHVGQPLME
ncbi:transporter substrate-binding domain-containing protein [uncultured Tateyamaria sp.]|uniref:substrate-binding periplasmic protein n=1 Tax=uncultured Tateyamaria sp. TaxID=455651 RepID=UPI00260F4AF1|nr:transporter substrate-binding domain-containing protein [uncultured Tateyamaria sp.]